ncbi:MAG: PLP-dependent aminotransferase family protein, partial [Dermatophilaceae bacterium]|nr:PLP-dependent aminotransferase family protein [Dermatophilaceae bacterium]
RLAEHGITVQGSDGLNIWVPVRDEAAAVLRLASHGIAVTPGSPFSVEPVSGPAGHVRVTTGLIRRDHAEVADLIAEAAAAVAWTAQHR